ncbi:SocA family protein [Rhizobium sp. 9T]|uniref:Panacea domain-containing protein n=1 Tax=Rhizobium croatiense TaxID=2867516 RepID=UPI001C936F71|nr:Panacea domain-containing protein [Rhizobium croatiense]MBY4609000.1 SocA family protein [Rhizobium croatiense]
MVRFNFDWEKTIDAIEFIARQEPGITQYYIGKILFFADREHILDYGRPITGDKYVAMEHGPVPSAVRNLLRVDGEYPDEVIDRLDARIEIQHDRNKQRVYSLGAPQNTKLSGSDKEYLLDAIQKYAHMSFGELRELSHDDKAYMEAWDRLGNANEMKIELWLDELDNAEIARAQLIENSRCAG